MSAGATLVTSWDDGHPSDLRLADLLSKHGLKGTFFVPRRNVEGRPTMDPRDIARLAAMGFEIGAHTDDHVRLDALGRAAATRQIDDGRRYLEDAIGAPVRGFAYPGGNPGRYGQALAAECFAYARTTRMFAFDPGRDPYDMPTTMQFFPHGTVPLVRNFLRGGDYASRSGAALSRLAARDPVAALGGLADRAARCNGTLHIWGHSWEFDALDLWDAVDTAFALLARDFKLARRASVADSAPCAR